MSDKPFCLIPWFHQKVNADGTMKPCCVWQSDGEMQIDRSYDHENFFHGDFMQELRQRFREDRIPSNCSKCTYLNQIGNDKGHREWGMANALEMGVDTADPQLMSQEVDISNLCNLRCRMCSQRRSSKWISDSVALGQEPVGLLESGWSLSEAHASTVKMLMFLGGEPTLHQDRILAALQQVDRLGRLDQLTVRFISNLTVPLEQPVIDLLRKTRSNRILCSIDGYGALNDYVRSDSEWPVIERNVAQLVQLSNDMPNLTVGLSYALSVYNAAGFHEFAQWWHQYKLGISCTLVQHLLDARNLPREEKQRIADWYLHMVTTDKQLRSKHVYRMIIQHLNQDAVMDQEEWRQQMRHYNGLLDQRRGTRLADVYPQLAEILA